MKLSIIVPVFNEEKTREEVIRRIEGISLSVEKEVSAQPYQLKIGDKEIQVSVSEEDVLEGRIIEILTSTPL